PAAPGRSVATRVATRQPGGQPGADDDRDAKSADRLSRCARRAQPLGAGVQRNHEHAGIAAAVGCLVSGESCLPGISFSATPMAITYFNDLARRVVFASWSGDIREADARAYFTRVLDDPISLSIGRSLTDLRDASLQLSVEEFERVV